MTIGGLWESGEGALRRPPGPVHLALPFLWSRA
jgi:hypothetical protein